MKLGLIHLSDAHFSPQNKLPDDQIRAISTAVHNSLIDSDAIVIIFSGDIADKGQEADYEVAKEFLTSLKRELATHTDRWAPQVFAVPGNHDVNVKVLGDAGEILANDIVTNEKQLEEAEGTYRLLASAQSNFWSFNNTLSGVQSLDIASQLFKSELFTIKTQKVRLNLFNTAILSRKREVQGQLWFPLELTKGERPSSSAGDLEISIFHHPYGWLESNNAVRFRQFVETHSDIAFNGHQHTVESYFASSLEGETTWYSAGAALLDEKTGDSGFSVIEIDFSQRTRRLVRLKWNGNLYVASNDSGLKPYSSDASKRRGFTLTDQFADYLADPETLIVNTQKKQVLLSDIFETPRLRGGLTKSNSPSKVVLSDRITEILEEGQATYIFGESLSGKTCLGKQLFGQLFQRDGSSIPIYLSAKDLKTSRTGDIEKWVSRAYRKQYKQPTYAEYSSLDKGSRVVIVDDWHSLGFNTDAKHLVIRWLCNRHRNTILLCDSWYQTQELASVIDATESDLPKNHFTILPLTPYQRSNMIKRWIGLGRSDSTTDASAIFELDTAEKALDELSRNRLMPPYPLYVLSALQTLQATRQSEPDLGAQGVLFDILVGDKLRVMSEDAPDLDVNRGFIAYLAREIFNAESYGLTKDRIITAEREFFRTYAVTINLEPLIEKLVDYKVLYRSDGVLSFRHRHMYYYFVAENFAGQLIKRGTSADALKRLKEMARFIAYEEYSQILMFVIYKTRNEELIEELILNADLIFENQELSDLNKDVEFANRLDIERPEMYLPQESIVENRDARRRAMLDPAADSDDQESFPQKVSYSNDLDWAAKLQYGFKTTQMLGRVLRNFPGSLDAVQKEQLAVGAYGVSLRMLNWILVLSEREKEHSRAELLRVVEDSANGETATDRFRRADALLSSLITLCCFGVVRFLALAVGSSKLDETYKKVTEALESTPASKLIDLAIRMDYFRGIPIDNLYELQSELKGNFIATQVLRLLVWQRLTYLPIDDRNLKNQICARFDISGSSAPVVIATPPRLN